MMRRLRLVLAALGLSAVVLLGFAGTAAAQAGDELYPTPTTEGEVAGSGVVESRDQAPPTSVARSGALPVTGSDVAGLAVIGVGAIAIGSVLVLQRRRSDAAA